MTLQPNPNFRIVGVEDDDPAPQPSPQEQAVAIKMLQVALGALWQQFTVAVANCFVLLAAASVFILFYVAPPDPSVKQLTMLGLYAGFILIASFMVIWSRGRK